MSLESELLDIVSYIIKLKVFLACASVGTVGLLDETMIAVSLPIIGSELNAGSQVSWFATAYFVFVPSVSQLKETRTNISAGPVQRANCSTDACRIFGRGNLSSSP